MGVAQGVDAAMPDINSSALSNKIQYFVLSQRAQNLSVKVKTLSLVYQGTLHIQNLTAIL